jgi:hypothetical protein
LIKENKPLDKKINSTNYKKKKIWYNKLEYYKNNKEIREYGL